MSTHRGSKELKHLTVAIAVVLIVWGIGVLTFATQQDDVGATAGFGLLTLLPAAIILTFWTVVVRRRSGASE